MIANGYQKYQQNSVMTASPKELILMLYNGAIKFCNLAVQSFEEGEVQKQHMYIIKVQDIITELEIALDPKYEISKEIRVLYTYIKELLVQANVKKDVQLVLEAKELISEFRNTWQELMKLA